MRCFEFVGHRSSLLKPLAQVSHEGGARARSGSPVGVGPPLVGAGVWSLKVAALGPPSVFAQFGNVLYQVKKSQRSIEHLRIYVLPQVKNTRRKKAKYSTTITQYMFVYEFPNFGCGSSSSSAFFYTIILHIFEFLHYFEITEFLHLFFTLLRFGTNPIPCSPLGS